MADEDTDIIGNSDTESKQKFITRIFHENNNQVIGAEVVIFDDGGEKIDSIIVTDTTSLEDFQTKWENISNYYILNDDVELPSDLQEKVDTGAIKTLQSILNNANNTTPINATTLNGLYTSDNFSLIDHDHDDKYCTKNHISTGDEYGLGTSNVFGHTKIVDNLNDSTFKEATALSSRQGYELNQKITDLNGRFQWSSVKTIGNYMRYRVNEDLRLLIMNYNRSEYKGCKKTTGDHELHKAGTIPSSYLPTGRVTTPLYRGDFVLFYNTDGSVKLYNLTTKDKINIHAQVMWHF